MKWIRSQPSHNGEWCGGGVTNCPACYVGGTRPVVEARFQVKPPDLTQASLGARASEGNFPLGDVMTNDVRFANGDSGWVRFRVCDGTNTVPMRVDLATSKWNWRVDRVQADSHNEPVDFSTTGPHKVYDD